MTKKNIASVVLDNYIDKTLDYQIPDDLIISEGMRVEVPLRNRLSKGYVCALKEKSSIKTKAISKVLSEDIIPKDLLALALWMSKYYAVSLHKVFKTMIPTCIRNEIQPKMQVFLQPTKTKKEMLPILISLQKKFPAQAKVLEFFLQNTKGFFLSDLIKKADISKSPIDTLIKKKILRSQKILSDQSTLLLDTEYFLTKPKKFTIEQQTAYDNIEESINSNQYQTHLLYGITGSGKTEIYLQAIQKALDQNKGSIMLVPEVALTSQTIEHFRARFSEKIAVLHHRRSQGERYEAWQSIYQEKARIVIGARSAIFSPVKNLGLIIVDEEHDSSYKQSEDSPTYHARNIACVRGKMSNACVVLGSATPSLESFYNAEKKKYLLSTIKTRPQNALLPTVSIINMKEEIQKTKSALFSQKLLDGIHKRFEKGEQSLIFLNRRGYQSFLFCSFCSHVVKCPHCDVSLTYHKKQNILLCHSCSYTHNIIKNCPKCGCQEHLKYKGFGTELVQSALNAIFPNIRTLRMDRDTTTTKNSHEMLFKTFRSGKADVLIGTQMIVKGLHFPSLTLVGVLNTDGALNIPDFRSSENVFQLITQVAGRAGRSSLKGEVIIQSFMHDNATLHLAAKQDYDQFYKEEIENRKLFNYPPFSSIAKILFSGLDEQKTSFFAKKYREELIKHLPENYQMHPVVAAGHAKIQDKYRFLFLIRGPKSQIIAQTLNHIKIKIPLPKSVHLLIDIDALHTFF